MYLDVFIFAIVFYTDDPRNSSLREYINFIYFLFKIL